MNLDWDLLRKQKSWLIRMGSGNASDYDKGMVDGLLSLIDHLQDEAVVCGMATEKEVFGK